MSIDFMILRIGDEIAEYTDCDEVDLAEALTAIEPILQEQAATHAHELRAYEATVANLEERIRQLEAERVPEGWQPVPAEPTDEMIDHGCDAADAFRVDIVRAYQAMLSAAPAPEDSNHG